MKVILALLLVVTAAPSFAQYAQRPDPMAEYAARQRMEAEQRERQLRFELERQRQEQQRQQFNQQMGGAPIQGIPYQVRKGP